MAVTDADGIIYYRYVYDTYGELSDITTDDGVSLKTSEQLTEYRLAELAHATGIDYLYNGQYGVETDQNGLYYMRARYYNQDIKRFINRDVISGDIGNSQSLNRYCYVQGNPVSLTDPFGLCPDGNAAIISMGLASGTAMFALFGRPIDGMSGSSNDSAGSSWGHIALDILGIFFDAADLVNAVWYAWEGNWEMAIISGICALPFVGNLIGGTVGLALKVVGSGLTFSLAAKGTFDAVGRAYKDYQNGTLGWHNVLDIGLNGLALAGTGYMFKKGIGDALNGNVTKGIPGWLSEHTIPLNNKGFVDLKALKGLFSKPNVITGKGYDAGDTPVRIDGKWSISDLKQALLGHPPRGLGSPDIHHGGQMPGASKHEVLPNQHRNNSALHPNKYNQGVTTDMRVSDRKLHWWYRAREQGADELLPDWIYDD